MEDMMEQIEERRRIQPGDCLYVCLQDLQREASELRLSDLPRLRHWSFACADLLAQVPDQAQRLAWADALGQRMNRFGISQELVIGELLRLALAAEGR